MIIDILILILALVGVVKAADWFLNAAEKVGVSIGLPPFILGVILVGFGTSLPELATSLAAVADGVNDVSIANIAGSNIANIFLILGIATIVMGTIRFDKDLIDLDVPLLLGVTILFGLLLIDGNLGRFDGMVLLTVFAFYILYSLGYREDSKHHKGLVALVASLTRGTKRKVEKRENLIGPYTIIVLIFSVILLGASSKFAVDSMLRIVKEVSFGVGVLSFFALAIGTSLPELTVSIKSLRAGKGDIVVGNIIGSCMFNMLLIGGVASVMRPQVVSAELLPWMLGGMLISVLLINTSTISKRIHIWEGVVFILLYIVIATKIIS